MLRKLGFAEQWCKWIMTCVTTVSYNIFVNGSPVGKIFPTRGIRQGDPISPHLYLLCTKGLFAILQNYAKTKRINGFKTSRNGPSISHMFFADDCRSLLEILSGYE